MTTILEQISGLSVEEKIVLVERIWDDIADDSRAQSLTISPQMESELARRLDLIKNNQTQLLSWDDVKNNVFSEYKKQQ
jgi:putative addiction module component (TIGR02574 family)